MSKKVLNTVGIALTIIISIICLSSFTQKEYKITIIGEKGSYAEKFAKKKKIEFEEIYESNKEDYQKELQELEYNTLNGDLTVSGYKGTSNILIIPKSSNGQKIIDIDYDFLKNTNVKTIVIQDNIKELDTNILENYHIECYENTYCNNLDKKKYNNIKILNKFPYNYIETELNFEYSTLDNKIILKEYKGTSEEVIIPTRYNGLEITTIDFDLNKTDIRKIYLPKTITAINLSNDINYNLIIALILNIISLIIFMIFTSLMTSKNLEETFNNAPRGIILIISLIVELVLSLMYSLNKLDIKSYLIVIIIMIIIETVLYFILGMGKKHIERHNEKVKKVNSYKDELLKIIADKKNDNNNLFDLEEKIKYSDPVSNDYVKELEKEIYKQISSITKNTSKEAVDKIIDLINKRNDIIKSKK